MEVEQRTAPPEDVGTNEWDFRDPARHCRSNGLLAVGADLEPSTLVAAYRAGVFPWPGDDGPLPWFSPNPRGVLPLSHFRCSKSLRQRLRRTGWEASVDFDFRGVITACAQRLNGESTWISDDMRAAYLRLHELGWAHSIEIWEGSRLVGGCYGLLLGGVFTGESMFHHEPDASKIALLELVTRMQEAKGSLIDVQMVTEHLASLGAIAIHRSLFLEILHEIRNDDIRLLTGRLPVSRLADAATVPG
jgi:leucyl/phenylalanyl-tRNA---protein transferase